MPETMTHDPQIESDDLSKEKKALELEKPIEDIKITFEKTSIFQKAGRFLLTKFYQIGLKKNDLNDIYIKELSNPENIDKSINDIKSISEEKYHELYAKETEKEFEIVDAKIKNQVDVLTHSDDNLLSLKHKGLSQLKKDLSVWMDNIEEMENSENTGSVDKTKIREIKNNLEKHYENLDNLEKKYKELKKDNDEPGFFGKIFSGISNFVKENATAFESKITFLHSKEYVEKTSPELDEYEKILKKAQNELYETGQLKEEEAFEELLNRAQKELGEKVAR